MSVYRTIGPTLVGTWAFLEEKVKSVDFFRNFCSLWTIGPTLVGTWAFLEEKVKSVDFFRNFCSL